jgi:hypothetical protein
VGPLSTGDKHGSDDEYGAAERDCCAICLVEYQDGDEVSWSHNISCDHAFHRDCIIEWLLTSNECPCCRRNYLRFFGDGENAFIDNDVVDELPPPPVGRDRESQLNRGLQLFSQFSQGPINPPRSPLRFAASDVENSSGRSNRADSSNLGLSVSLR